MLNIIFNTIYEQVLCGYLSAMPKQEPRP